MIAPTLDCGCGGSGVCSDCALGDLSNVDTTGAVDGNVLVFDSGVWIPGEGGGGSFACADLNGCSIDDLGDVDAPAPTDGQVLTWVDADSEWQSVDPSGGSQSGFKDFATTTYSVGNIALDNQTANFAAVPSLSTLTVDAVEGDIISLDVQIAIATAGAPTTNIRMDVATMVSGSPVNYFSGGGVTDEGLLGWLMNSVAVLSLDGAAYHVVEAGDIDAGTVTCSLRFKTTGANQLIAVASATQHIILNLINYGQPAPSPSPTGLAFRQTIVSADVAANSATWAKMDASSGNDYEVTVPAAEGDILSIKLATYPNAFSASAQVALDVATIVSAAVVNRISGGTGNSDLGCLEAFQVQGSGQALYGGHITRDYVVQAGDVDGGNVLLQGVYRNPVGSCTLSAAAGIRSFISVVNLGPSS